jgi:DNA-binding NarL/FixJ family response regulator/signal transduction histidine kinase
VAHRGPLWFARYEDVPGGHVDPAERATLRGVIGVPLEWRGRIIGACIVFSRDDDRVFGPGDAELLQLFAKHAAIALANAHLHEVAEERARAEAAASERDRLLAEVHDTITQRLVSIRMHLDSAEEGLANAAAGESAGGEPAGGAVDAAVGHLRQASTAARDGLAEARLTLLGLSAAPLEGRTLADALRSEVAWAQSIGRLEVRFVSAGPPVVLEERLSREVLRVAREALTNIVRHAGASTARLGLLYEQGAVSLLVQDDGQGFDPRSGWQADRFGLRAVTDRAREFGATVEVDSLAGWGTRVRARFPYLPDQQQTGPRLRVLIAARRPVLRAGLARLLSWTEPGIEVVGEVATAEQTVDACRDLQPDVALVDLSLPTADGAELRAHDGAGVTGALLAHCPDVAVVGLCEAVDDEQVAEAIRAGARGCVDAAADGPELARAVVAAGRGHAILSGQVLGQLHRGLQADDPEPGLTLREREVRDLMVQGVPDKVIAERLVLSVKTVEKHAGAVLRKTGARNRTELAALAGRGRLKGPAAG